MAEDKRGGRRVPEKSASYSGVGKNSRRTDGGPIKGVPNVQDGTDLTHGDRAKLEAGQKIAPIQARSAPQMTPGGGGGRVPPMGGGGGLPPDHLMGLPSTRPNEPETEGLAEGPGAGPEVLNTPPESDDIRVLALERYARVYDNPEAKRMLSTHYKSRVPQASMAPMPVNPLPSEGEPEIEPSMDLDVPMEEDASDEAPVEEPIV